MEDDGLITQGDSSTQLTWMDAKCGGHAFTPRQGKAVEINALWYHALVLMGETDLAGEGGRELPQGILDQPVPRAGRRGGRRSARGRADPAQPDLRRQPAQQPAERRPADGRRRGRAAGTADAHGPAHAFDRSDPGYKRPLQRTSAASAMRPTTTARSGPGRSARSCRPICGSTSDRRSRSSRPGTGSQPLIEHMEQNCIGQIAEIFEGDAPAPPGRLPRAGLERRRGASAGGGAGNVKPTAELCP